MKGTKRPHDPDASFDEDIKSTARRLLADYRSTGALDQKVLGELEALKSLRHLVGNPPRRGRYVNLIVLALAAFILAVLLLFRVPATEIELIAYTTDVGFRTSGEPRPLAETLVFDRVAFNRAASVSLNGEPPIEDADGLPLAFGIMSEKSGLIGLVSPVLPSGSNVGIHMKTGDQIEADVVVPGTFELRLALENANDLYATTQPESLDLALDDGDLLVRGVPALDTTEAADDEHLVLTFSARGAPEIARQMQVASLDFTRVDIVSDPRETRNAPISGIESGTLYLETLDSRELTLRPGEPLRLSGVDGTLRTIELGQGLMTVQFRGSVRGLSIGFGDPPTGWFSTIEQAMGLGNAPRSLMPTLSEWLQARTSVITLVSGAAVLFSTLAALLARPKD